MSTILITGAAGFIGFFVAQRLLADGMHVIGVDNLNDYYDPALKQARLAILDQHPRFEFHKLDLADDVELNKRFADHGINAVVHLAAQAGVRYSLENPQAYISSNLVGFANILECCRHGQVKHLVFASSSSVYGANTRTPFAESHNVDHPVSLYAATKKSNELMAHSYAHLYRLPVTGLRFFTVYGPWGRPDMAYFSFTRKILAGEPIPVFNRGEMWRDFTYIDDIVSGIVGALNQPAAPDPTWSGSTPEPATSSAPYRMYNIGNDQPVRLLDMIRTLETVLGVEANIDFQPMQPGDVPSTHANIDRLGEAVGFRPTTTLKTGLEHFASWYRAQYR